MTADDGIVMTTVGFHEAPLLPTVAVAVNAVRLADIDCASRPVAWPGVNTPTPLVAVDGPDQYATAPLPMVSLPLARPVVKSVDVTEVVQPPRSVPRWSSTL